MSQVLFIKNNTVIKCFHENAIISIAEANIRKDWQAIISTNNSDVSVGWNYNPDTGLLTAPE